MMQGALDEWLGNGLHGRMGRIMDDTDCDSSHCWNCLGHAKKVIPKL